VEGKEGTERVRNGGRMGGSKRDGKGGRKERGAGLLPRPPPPIFQTMHRSATE